MAVSVSHICVNEEIIIGTLNEAPMIFMMHASSSVFETAPRE